MSDPAEMREFLESAYGVRLRLSTSDIAPPDGKPLLTHARTDVGTFAIEEIELVGDLEAAPDPINKVVVAWPSRGWVASQCDGIAGKAGAGEVTLMTQPDLPHYARAESLRVTSLLLDPPLVGGVATGLPVSQAPLGIRFSSFQPVDLASGRLWQQTVNYVKNSVLADDSLATPLVLGHASRLLAAVTLSTFPNTATVGTSPHDRNDHQPELLRRAIEYIDANAASDISLADIAEAVHVTPRAVQYMFRRNLDMTPMQYLRRIRLHHAHEALLAGDRMRDSVTAIAARWGFMHTSRFAVLYRETYGRSPHATLRG
ncbi:helix-turn-helix transcriptional regulator [Mycobacterium sp.]|uniref:helix-turn-helix transcriptional regulator n=1 Tax=Mycobacterium sp. TaxID=1785 RepID=UPI002D8FC4B5|nr:helix-turn-helix transcriptional regulator [Mycobacterium sp.]